LTLLTFLLIVRTIFHSRVTREKIIYTPPPSSPTFLAEKKPLVEEKPKDEQENKTSKKAVGPKRVVGRLNSKKKQPQIGAEAQETYKILVFYSSLTGTTEKTAKAFTTKLTAATKEFTQTTHTLLEPELLDLSYIDYDEYFINPPKSDDTSIPTRFFYLMLLPSYNIDSVLDIFLEHLQETHNDFRIDTAPLSELLGYSVFGFGDREGWPTEAEGFCSQATQVDKWMAKLTGRKRAFPLGMGDTKTDAQDRLQEWTEGVQDVLENLARTGNLGEGVTGSGDAVESDVEDVDEDDGEVVFDDETTGKKQSQTKSKSNMDDLEDLGRILQSSQSESEKSELRGPIAVDFTTYGKKAKPVAAPVVKEMVPKSSPTYTALTKQGYQIVGSHSGVKICRWTKSALRGRGSCYKYSFYGIASHQCMETTPSLSCSNKCVFCWRHGTNPVGTTCKFSFL
jgi:tRNA wybutosine-synthesizing protein 1